MKPPTGRRARTVGELLVVSALMALVVIVSPPTAPAEEVLKIGGTGSALGSMKLIGQAFEKAHPGIKVKVMPSIGSRGCIKGVSDGSVDIGLSSRQLKDHEHKAHLSIIPYARTPFVAAANRAVAVRGLKQEDLVRIYRGKLQKWPDGRKIRLVMRPASDTDIEYLKKISPEMKGAVEAALSKPGALKAQTDQQCADKIEATPGALGFLTLTQVNTEKRKVRVLAYNGVTPSLDTLAKGSYTLAKHLHFVTRDKPSEKVKKFIAFVQSPKGRKLLEKSGNLPAKAGAVR
jgi:phosphate transport system substrate-binding protein